MMEDMSRKFKSADSDSSQNSPSAAVVPLEENADEFEISR